MKKLWKRNQIMITALALMIAIAGYLNFMGKKVDEEALFTTSAQFEEASTDLDAQNGLNSEANGSNMGDMAVITDVTNDQVALLNEDTDESANLTDIDSMDSDDEMAISNYLDENQADALPTSGAAIDGSNETATTDGTNQTAITDAADQTAQGQSAAVTEDYDGETPGEAVFTSTSAISSVEGANLLKEQTRAKNKEALMAIINSDNLPDSAKQDAVDSMIALTDLAQKECSAEILLEAKGFENVVVSISGDMADVIVAANDLSDAQRAQIEDIVVRKTGVAPENIIISPVAEK